ncbi:aldo/keto reductase [Frondihabitans australicus]|uniref:Aryl-alcohol dehydrogenase-like predicted oxidoreductase n=1 Tax=Frondihabitans australicus TaxID=386892 RepID=A0A495IHN7_9MICO|nr:aldo/keto reductase [Frondihabitans australicus]RKR75220.1 aryl-alcohol dehydrogenase-like predicted oxidoreductase [Frondihabitans australicus]
MEYRPLGSTGMTVSQLCLGAMMFGAFGNADHADSVRVIHRALDAGITFIDTADGYSNGESEEILGEALAGGRRDDVVLAVKFGGPKGDNPHTGASRAYILSAVDESLKRLGTDHIDLYQLGVPDPGTPIEESIEALSDLVDQGKIRAFGASKVTPSRVVEGRWASERLGRGFFETEQPPYSLLTRAIEYDLLPTTRRYDMGVLSYSALAAGWLSGRYHSGAVGATPGSAARSARPARFDVTNPANAAKVAAVDAFTSLAADAGLTLVQLATAFVVRHPAVTSAIIGPRTMEHLDGYLAADGVVLSDEVLDRIDEIVPPGTSVDVVDNMWWVDMRDLAPAARRR